MARVLESDSKAILKKYGVPIPKGFVASNPYQAKEAAQKIGLPVVIKALIPVGKRGKSGGIQFADTLDEVYYKTKDILAMTLSYYPIEKVLIEQKLPIKKELYLSITIDKFKRTPVIIASSMGGIDIEELSNNYPNKIHQIYVDPIKGLAEYKTIEIWSDLGLKGDILRQTGRLLYQLYSVFIKYDATTLEINPLVITEDDKVIIAASVLSIDESSLYRQPELSQLVQAGSERTWRPLTNLEKHLISTNDGQEVYRGTARYTEFDNGDIGFMCGGGGASLLLMDALYKAGGRPANYSEVGGNPTENKVYELCKGILSKEGVKGLFLAHNITSNTQINVVARGVVQALNDLRINPACFPIVVREAGTYESEGKRIFEEAGVKYHGDDITLNQAAQMMVDKMRNIYPDYDEWGNYDGHTRKQEL